MGIISFFNSLFLKNIAYPKMNKGMNIVFSNLIVIEKTNKSNVMTINLTFFSFNEIKNINNVNPIKKTEEISAEEY